MRPDSRLAVLALGLVAAACASAPPVAPPPATYEQKLAWMLRLEDERVLRDLTPVPPPAPAAGTRRPAAAPAPRPDLIRLLDDDEARVRRRAALAVGRVGLAEGVPSLIAHLNDPEREVRQMAAFALGLIGNRRAVSALTLALSDPSPIVQARAAEALGLIGDPSAAPTIAMLVRNLASSADVAAVAPGDTSASQPPLVEVFRLGLFALARLRASDPLASAVLAPNGEPMVRWWPVAYALQRVRDPRSVPALLSLVGVEDTEVRTFAAAGLGALKVTSAVDVLLRLAGGWQKDARSAVAAVRALGQIGEPRAVPALLALIRTRDVDPSVQLEAVTAVGACGAPQATETLVDLVAHPWPALRAASLRSLRQVDPQTFLLVLSGLDPDPHWSVRAAIASIVGTLPADVALPRLTAALTEPDLRVVPEVLAALAKIGAPDIEAVLLAHLKHDDPIIRMAAARELGTLKPASGPAALADAYQLGQRDSTYVARAAALTALAGYGAAIAKPLVDQALSDKDWAVRVRAASLLTTWDPTADAATRIRPAPTGRSGEAYAADDLVAPRVSPHVLIETDQGTIEIELLVVEAPQTVASFVRLARSGFFDGSPVHRVVPNFVVQDGDPRGDGEGGPGFTLRDELNQVPYLRGTVGMALDWPDTGGSQFFITSGPQPHLDARYTVFGRVVAGLDLIDRIRQWDVIRRVRVWDGTTLMER